MLAPSRGGLFVDCTVGLGGHARALLEAARRACIGARSRSGGARARARGARAVRPIASSWCTPTIAICRRVLDARGIDARRRRARRSRRVVDAVRRRGPRLQLPARRAARHAHGSDAGADARPICSRDVDEHELADVIFQFGEERFSRRIARAIVDGAARRRRSTTTGQLAAIVRRAIPRRGYQRIDPATRTFQALRIWVNRELDGLDAFLGAAARRLRAGARLAVITFHSLEDRIVKHTLRALAAGDAALPDADARSPLVPADDGSGAQPARAQREAARDGEARMSAMDFEYAIKKDVRNNPIVREVDEARQRELWQSVGDRRRSWSLVLLFSAWQHFELLRHGYQIEQMQQERAAEEEINRQLRLEIETLRAPARHRAARDRAAAPGRAGARRGDRHRAGDAVGAARKVHRRGAVTSHASGDRMADASGG